LLPQQPVGFSSVQPARCHPGWAPTPLSLPVGTRVFLIWTTGATPFPVFKGPFAYWKAQTYHQRGTALPHPQPTGLLTLKKKKKQLFLWTVFSSWANGLTHHTHWILKKE
jgi:hypothetical protein